MLKRKIKFGAFNEFPALITGLKVHYKQKITLPQNKVALLVNP